MKTRTDSSPIRPMSAFGWLALASALTAAVLAAIGYWPTRAQAGPAGVAAMLAALVICLLGGWAGALPTVAYLNRPAREHPTGILAGLAARFAVTLGLALAAVLTRAFASAPLLLWVGMGQLVILAVDVFGLVGLLRRAARECR